MSNELFLKVKTDGSRKQSFKVSFVNVNMDGKEKFTEYTHTQKK